MRPSMKVGLLCLLVANALILGALVWAGAFRGAILILLAGLFASTFSAMVDLREREERAASRWPARDAARGGVS